MFLFFALPIVSVLNLEVSIYKTVSRDCDIHEAEKKMRQRHTKNPDITFYSKVKDTQTLSLSLSLSLSLPHVTPISLSLSLSLSVSCGLKYINIH